MKKVTVKNVAEAQAMIQQIAPASYKNYSLFSKGEGDIDKYLKRALKKNDEVSIWYSDKEDNADNEYCIYTDGDGKAGVTVRTWSATENDYNVVAKIEIDYNTEDTEKKAVENAEEKAAVEVEEYAVSVDAQEVAIQAEIDAARALQFNLKEANNVSDEEKIYRATSLIVKDYGSSPVTKDFKTAAEAFKYLKEKEKRYAATTEWEHTIQVWDSAEDADKYEECFSIAEEHTIYKTDSYADEEEEFLAFLESTLADCKTVDTTTDTETNEIPEYKPALADKPYTCVTLRRYSEFSSSSFNPEKFFDTLNDAVKCALTDRIKRRGVDERYGGAVVYLDYENGMHRPLWQITSEGNFETIDANNDYGELDNGAVKAELAELDADTLAALAAEVEIKATLDKLTELKEAYPQIYSKVTADSAANVLTFKAKTSRKAKRIAS